MALTYNAIFKTLPAPEAYLRIVSVVPDVELASTRVYMQLWASRAHRLIVGETPLDTIVLHFPYDPATGDIIAWGYAKVKSHPRYSHCEDVIETPVVVEPQPEPDQDLHFPHEV